MSVLINMEMPTSCRACRLKMNCDDCEGWECVCVPLHQQIGYLGDLLTDKRRDDCPLVPVPEPHGRLIDADALMEKFLETYTEYERKKLLVFYAAEVKQEVADMITDVPTIIPAEEGE